MSRVPPPFVDSTVDAVHELPLAKADEYVRQSAERLLAKPQHDRPFVVVEKACDAGCFVQLAGSDGEPLLIDCPRLGVSEPIEQPEVGRRVVAMLEQLGCNARDVVRVSEEVTGRPS